MLVEGAGSLESASLGPRPPCRTPCEAKIVRQRSCSNQPRRPRIPGICQPETPDLGVPPDPPKTDPNKHDHVNGEGFGVLIITD